MNRLASVLIVAVALTFATAAPASAQVTWTGFSVGAHVGAGFRVPQVFDATDLDGYNRMFVFNDFFGGPVSGGLPIGGQAGYSRAIGERLVAGGEFSIGTWGYKGSGASTLNGGDTEGETRGGTYWTALARVGYTFGNAMPYFTAGFISTSNKVEVIDDCTANPCGGGTVHAVGSGSGRDFAWGGGLEYALKMKAMNKRWTVKVEWLNSSIRNDIIAEDGSSGFRWSFRTFVPNSVIRGMVNVYLK